MYPPAQNNNKNKQGAGKMGALLAGQVQGWQAGEIIVSSLWCPWPPQVGQGLGQGQRSLCPGHQPDLFCPGLTREVGWHA